MGGHWRLLIFEGGAIQQVEKTGGREERRDRVC